MNGIYFKRWDEISLKPSSESIYGWEEIMMSKPLLLSLKIDGKKSPIHVPIDDVDWEGVVMSEDESKAKIYLRVVYEKPAKVLIVSEKDIRFIQFKIF